MGPLIGAAAEAAPDLLKSAASGVTNSAEQQQQDQATTKTNSSPLFQQGVEAGKNLQPSTEQANEGVQQAAGVEKQIAAPTGAAVKNTGLQTAQTSQQYQNQAFQNYKNAVANTNDLAIKAEQALKDTAEAAKIDPQAYLHGLGTGDKVLTAIGMVLSGIGSGLTGQPNLAVDVYQRNTERAIQAQQKIFENKMIQSAQAQGLLHSAQDRQTIATNAYNMATMSVMSGNNAAIDGAMTQVKGAAAPFIAQQLKNENNIKFQQALNSFNAGYIGDLQSNDSRKVNQLGNILSQANDHFIQIHKNTAQQRAIPKAPEPKNTEQPPTQSQQGSSEAKSEGKTGSFYDSLKKMFSKDSGVGSGGLGIGE